MKATFKFQLPEEQHEFEKFLKAGDYSSCLYQIACLIRGKTKFSDQLPTDWVTVSQLIWEIFEDFEIDPYT